MKGDYCRALSADAWPKDKNSNVVDTEAEGADRLAFTLDGLSAFSAPAHEESDIPHKASAAVPPQHEAVHAHKLERALERAYSSSSKQIG